MARYRLSKIPRQNWSNLHGFLQASLTGLQVKRMHSFWGRDEGGGGEAYTDQGQQAVSTLVCFPACWRVQRAAERSQAARQPKLAAQHMSPTPCCQPQGGIAGKPTQSLPSSAPLPAASFCMWIWPPQIQPDHLVEALKWGLLPFLTARPSWPVWLLSPALPPANCQQQWGEKWRPLRWASLPTQPISSGWVWIHTAGASASLPAPPPHLPHCW